MTLPTNTPSAETAASAKLAPRNTAHGLFVCAAIVIAASCVLSPISAKKIIPKVVSSTRRSIFSLLDLLQVRNEDCIANQSAAGARQLLAIVRPIKTSDKQVFEVSDLLRWTT